MSIVSRIDIGIKPVMQKLSKIAILSASALTIVFGSVNVQAQDLDIEKLYNTKQRA
jgi:hypothetical protein